MRFNRVLLLAASVNLAVLAMLFTISCSGDKGAKGKDADFSQCAIEDGKLVCGGTVIGELPGGPGDPNDPNSGAYCLAISGTKVQCGDKTLDFGVAGCNVSEFMGRTETVQINCSGDVFGICFGVPYDFSSYFCDHGEVASLPLCGADKTVYNPNKGEACVDGKTIVQCSDEEFYWTLSSTPGTFGGVYSVCGVDPRYRECKDNTGAVVGKPFFVGVPRPVSDYVDSPVDEDGFIITKSLKIITEYQGTQYCQNPNTAAAKVASCADEYGAGYVPDQGSSSDVSKDLRAFTSCKLAANYAVCTRTSGDVGTFDARTHICMNRGTASAVIASCAELNGGFSEFVPMPGKGISGLQNRQMRGFNECGLDPAFGRCNDTYGVIGVFNKQTEVCKAAGTTGAYVEPCGPGLIPDARNRECLMGDVECTKRKGFWDEDKQLCFASAMASCYENNSVKTRCQYFYVSDAEQGWSTDGESDWLNGKKNPVASNRCADLTLSSTDSTGHGRWTPSVITSPGTTVAGVSKASADKYFDRYGNEGKGICYDNHRAYCDDGKGLWIGSTSDPNEANVSTYKACKSVIDLDEIECVSNRDKGYFWGFLQTPGNVGGKLASEKYCSVGEIEAKATCEKTGNYDATLNVVGKANNGVGTYGWNSTDKECVRLYSSNTLVKSFKTKAGCTNSSYFWDEKAEKCFISIQEAEAACLKASYPSVGTILTSHQTLNAGAGGNWNTNTCSAPKAESCVTGKWSSSCSNISRTDCHQGGFYYDTYRGLGNPNVCVEKLEDCNQGNGASGRDCKDAESVSLGQCFTTENIAIGKYIEINGVKGLVDGQCITPEFCILSNGFVNAENYTCVEECKTPMTTDNSFNVPGIGVVNTEKYGISIYGACRESTCAEGNFAKCSGSTIGRVQCATGGFWWDAFVPSATAGTYASRCVDKQADCSSGKSVADPVNTPGFLCEEIVVVCGVEGGTLANCSSRQACFQEVGTYWYQATATCSADPCDTGEEVLDADGNGTRICLDPAACTSTYPLETASGSSNYGSCVAAPSACEFKGVQTAPDNNKCLTTAVCNLTNGANCSKAECAGLTIAHKLWDVSKSVGSECQVSTTALTCAKALASAPDAVVTTLNVCNVCSTSNMGNCNEPGCLEGTVAGSMWDTNNASATKCIASGTCTPISFSVGVTNASLFWQDGKKCKTCIGNPQTSGGECDCTNDDSGSPPLCLADNS